MYRKTVITGGVTEVFEYEHLNINAPGGLIIGDGDQHEDNYKQRQRLRRTLIRRLICSNFDEGSKFITLTFADRPGLDVQDVKQCNGLFMAFANRLRYYYPSFKYIAVIEFQDKNGRGAVHYHMVCNLPYVTVNRFAEIWRNGFVKLNRIDHVDNVGAYVIKYMVADMDDKRLCGKKAYLCSKGLLRPVELCSWRSSDTEVVEQIIELHQKESPTYYKEYMSENAGMVRYAQYNTNRKKSKDSLIG